MKHHKVSSRRSFLSKITKSGISFLVLAQYPTLLHATLKKYNTLLSNGDGIMFFHIMGRQMKDLFIDASKGSGEKVKDLFKNVIGAVNGIPNSNLNSTRAQEDLVSSGVSTVVSISFTAGVMTAASVASTGVIVAASFTPVGIAIAATFIVVALIVAIIEISKDRNLSIMIANFTDSPLTIDQIELSENSAFSLLDSDNGIVEGKPVNSIIPQAQQNEDGIVSTFIIKKKDISFDISGAIRLKDNYNNAYFIAWHSLAVGKNAISVSIKQSTTTLINATQFRNQNITPGEKKMQQTVKFFQENNLYSIDAALSDEDTEFPQAVVLVQKFTERTAIPEVHFNFKNNSKFPAYFAIFKIRYIDSNGVQKKWKSTKIADGKSVSTSLPNNVFILSINARKLDGTKWKRIRKIDYNKTGSEVGYCCFETSRSVSNAFFDKVRC